METMTDTRMLLLVLALMAGFLTAGLVIGSLIYWLGLWPLAILAVVVLWFYRSPAALWGAFLAIRRST